VIPPEYVKYVVHGIREALGCGVEIGDPSVDGHPVVDIVVRVIDGSFRETGSSQIAFTLAGSFAVQDAIKKAGPVVIK